MIGKTNSQTGGAIKGEKLNISLTSNQSDKSDLLGAIITVTHPGGTTQYAWEGYEITVDIPPYVNYSVEYAPVEGYATPKTYSNVAIENNSKTLTAEYMTTVVTASIKSNQTDTSDLANAAVTFGGKTLKNGQSAKIPTGTKGTPSWSAVTGYLAPTSGEVIAANASMTIEGTYQTEVVSVNVNADNSESMVGQLVTINGTQHVWNGTTIVQKIPFGTTYTIEVNEKEDYIAPSQYVLTANLASRNVTMTYTYNPATDLSQVDVHGNPVAQSTANCYVVKEPGKYMFPIAYGAAIKNGVANAEAYTNNGGANSHDFVNYNGNVITSPYVEVDTNTHASEVQIVNADIENAFSELEIIERADCRYIRFKVESVPTTGGNVIVSIKDASGVVMWNWHIWLWSGDLSPLEIINSTNVKYNIMPVNLASKYDSDGVHIKNWFYQWGRPNPMLLPSAYNSTSDHSPGSIKKTSKESSLASGISNPSTFFHNSSSPYNWFGDKSYYNLWDAACTGTGTSDNSTVKTVYDPCPVGWKIPNGNVFTGFSKISESNGVIKYTRYSGDTIGVEFPLSGLRSRASGSLVDVGRYGVAWTSAAKVQAEAYALYYYSNSVSGQGTLGRSTGASIRPVQDVDLALPTHKLTINVDGDTATPSGYEVKVYQVVESTDETTGEVTETLGDVLATQTTATATHEITWGAKYRVVASEVEGFVTPEPQTYTADQSSRNLTFTYVASALKVVISSNQGAGDSAISGVKATVKYGSTTLQVGNGETVGIPTKQTVTVTFPSVTGYATPSAVTINNTNGGTATASGEYKCSVVTVTLADNQTSYNDISSAKASVTGAVTASLSSGGSVKVPWGQSITITGTSVDGYKTPSATYTAADAAKAITLTWQTEILTVTVNSDGATPSGYTVTVKKKDGTTIGSQTSASKTYKIPYGTEYYVMASNISNFTTPANSSTFTAAGSSNASRSVTMTYQEIKNETLTVTVTGISSGYTVTVVNASSGATIGSQTTASKTYSITAGTKYYVKASDVSGYVAPANSATRTAVAGASHSVTMAYVAHEGTKNPTNGVWIQDTDGYFHTESAWSGKYTANGIAVITSNCRFVIALKDAYSSYCEWGSYGTQVTGIVTTTSSSTAKTDYNGEANTTTILNQLGNSSSTSDAPAAYYCRSYKFPNGATGYMGAAGEWQAALDNKAKIASALSKCGGTSMSSYYWTSTQYSSNYSWYMYWGNEPLDYFNKDYNFYVRAFAAI